MVGYQLQACPIVYQCQHMWSDQRTQWRVKKSLFGEQTHSGHLDNFSVFNHCIWEINSRGETAKSSQLAKLSKLSSAGGGREGGGQRWHIQKCIESNVSILCLASHQATTERRQKCRVNSFGGARAVLITCNYMDPIKYQVWNRHGGGANMRTSKLSHSHCPHPFFFLLLLFSIAHVTCPQFPQWNLSKVVMVRF